MDFLRSSLQLLFLYVYLHNVTVLADEECEVIRFVGVYIPNQAHRLNLNYEEIDEKLNKRPVFKRKQGSPDYVYWKKGGNWTAWSVGPAINGSSAGMVALDSARHPLDISAVWRVRTSNFGNSSKAEPLLRVECSSRDFPGWGVGLLVLGAVGLVAGTSGLACWCLYSNAKKNMKENDTEGQFYGLVPERRPRQPSPRQSTGSRPVETAQTRSGVRTHALVASNVRTSGSYPVDLE